MNHLIFGQAVLVRTSKSICPHMGDGNILCASESNVSSQRVTDKCKLSRLWITLKIETTMNSLFSFSQLNMDIAVSTLPK